MLNMMNDSKYI